MTDSARDRAIALLQQGCAHERNDAGYCRRPGAHGRDIDALLEQPEVLRALAGTVPAPAGDAPPVWWSPSRMSLIRDHGQPRGLVLHAHQHEERLAELPADAVPLVPAGGSAPHQGATTDAPLHEVTCPQCDATIRARMADHDGVTADVTALLAHLDKLDKANGRGWTVHLTIDEVRALLGAATTTAPEATP